MFLVEDFAVFNILNPSNIGTPALTKRDNLLANIVWSLMDKRGKYNFLVRTLCFFVSFLLFMDNADDLVNCCQAGLNLG